MQQRTTKVIRLEKEINGVSHQEYSETVIAFAAEGRNIGRASLADGGEAARPWLLTRRTAQIIRLIRISRNGVRNCKRLLNFFVARAIRSLHISSSVFKNSEPAATATISRAVIMSV
jgi:hypothetical protein